MIAVNAATPLVPYAVRELLVHYSGASREQVARGRAWYPVMRKHLAQLAAETGYTLEQAVAVLAITSPATQLATNLRWTEEALRSHGEARVGRFPKATMAKVRRALSNPDYATEYATGPKVSAFTRAILGDEDALVVDRWAYRAATGATPEESGRDPNTRERGNAIAEAYRTVAGMVGETVRDLQAILWIQARESTPSRRRGVIVQYADIV